MVIHKAKNLIMIFTLTLVWVCFSSCTAVRTSQKFASPAKEVTEPIPLEDFPEIRWEEHRIRMEELLGKPTVIDNEATVTTYYYTVSSFMKKPAIMRLGFDPDDNTLRSVGFTFLTEYPQEYPH